MFFWLCLTFKFKQEEVKRGIGAPINMNYELERSSQCQPRAQEHWPMREPHLGFICCPELRASAWSGEDFTTWRTELREENGGTLERCRCRHQRPEGRGGREGVTDPPRKTEQHPAALPQRTDEWGIPKMVLLKYVSLAIDWFQTNLCSHKVGLGFQNQVTDSTKNSWELLRVPTAGL